jgi:ribosomal-protein-alanine N-acetyltransferase
MIDIAAPLHIRPMSLSDLPAVMQIERQAMSSPWQEAGYRHELTGNALAHYLALLDGEQLIGYAGYWLIAGEAHISIIAVATERQGRGFGSLLLLAMLDDARNRGAQEASLEVRRGNLPAQTIYLRYGFQVVGERKGYYQDTGEDALLMTLDMSAPDYATKLAGQWRAWQQRYHTAHPVEAACT